jgi:mRNA interferase HigB
MRVITHKAIRLFVEKHPESNISLTDWYKKTLDSDWSCFRDIKTVFNSVDYVGNKRYVFNIGGNNYRLVAMIFFEVRQVYIRFVGTHAEYEKIDCKNI